MDAERDGNLSNVLPPGEIEGHSSLWAAFMVIRDKCDKYSIDALSTAADIFRVELHGSYTIGE